jgi:hypothetical protein
LFFFTSLGDDILLELERGELFEVLLATAAMVGGDVAYELFVVYW